MRIMFGSLKVDLPDLVNGELEEAENCIPSLTGYGPMPSAVAYSDALPSTCYGAYSTFDTSMNGYTFAFTQGSAYKENGGTFSSVQRTASYTTATDSVWEFATFGNTLLAVNGTDPLQWYSLGTSTRFLDASASASAPVAKNIAVVRDFVFLGNLSTYKNRVQWSQINSPLRYTVSQQRQSGYQDLPGEGGEILRITGGEFAAIFMKNSIWRGSYVGSPYTFRFDEVAPGLGALAGGSCARFQNTTFFLGTNGFYAFDGVQATPIGNDQVDAKVLGEINRAYIHRVRGVIDPVNKVYICAYPSTNSTDGTLNRMALYNWAVGKWALGSENQQWIFNNLSTGVTLEGLDAYGTMETLLYSLDSPVWSGGQAFLANINTDRKIARFTGESKTATFVTGEGQLVPDQRSFLRGIRPLVQGNSSTSITAQVGSRKRLLDDVTYTTESTMNDNGLCPVIADNRFHRLKMTVSGGFDAAFGADLDFVPSGVN